MTRRRSSTRPSSKSAWHRGPMSGSCSTRIGVMARSSGTTIATPAPHRRNSRMSLVRSGEGGEGRGALPSLAPGSGVAVEKTPKPLPPHARIVQPRRSAPLACGGKGGVGVYGFTWKQGLDEIWEREREGPGTIGGRIRAWRRRRQRRLPWQCSSSTNCTREVEGAAEGKNRGA